MSTILLFNALLTRIESIGSRHRCSLFSITIRWSLWLRLLMCRGNMRKPTDSMEKQSNFPKQIFLLCLQNRLIPGKNAFLFISFCQYVIETHVNGWVQRLEIRAHNIITQYDKLYWESVLLCSLLFVLLESRKCTWDYLIHRYSSICWF